MRNDKKLQNSTAASKDTWSSSFGFLMAAVGSAVGLGNIWGFPYKMGMNGGFAFLLIYIILAVTAGFSIMLAELALGRMSGRGPIGTFGRFSQRFKWLGWLGMAATFLILGFYSVLGGYCLRYLFINAADIITGGGAPGGAEVFAAVLRDGMGSALFAAIFIALSCVIVAGGVKGGIERFSKYAMPALLVMLIAVAVRALTLPGAAKGVEFMFSPDITPLQEDFWGVLSTAGSQMFLSLSLGFGVMITYGSYLKKSENIVRSAVIIPVADTIVALLAGVAVLPAAFALGGENAAMAGTSLLFVTLHDVFEAMGAAGPAFGAIFYALVLIAALTSSISMIEVMVSCVSDGAEAKGRSVDRKKTALLVGAAAIVPAVLVAADGLGKNGLWQPLGMSWLDFLDFISEGVMLPLGALMTAVFAGWEFGVKRISGEIECRGDKFRSVRYYSTCIKYIAPPVMIMVLAGEIMRRFAA